MSVTSADAGTLLLTGTERHRWRLRIVAVLLAAGILMFSFALSALAPSRTVEVALLQAIAALLVAGPAIRGRHS